MISLMDSGGIALWMAVLGTPVLLGWLRRRNIGQPIREDGIARHVIGIEWRRRRRARAELPIEDEGLADELCDPMAFPDSCVAARESLLHAMNDLDPDGLDLLIRRYILGKPGKDLAEEMELSPAALRMRLMRLRTTALPRPFGVVKPT